MARRAQIVEYRTPRAATVQTAYQAPGQPMVPEWDADQALRYAYYANTFVYACARAIAADLSRLPFRVGNPTTGEWDDTHPMAVHLGPPPEGPNPVTSARKLVAWSIVQYLVTGRTAWEIEPDSQGAPLAYWPLPTSNLKAIPSTGGATYWQSFKYGPPQRERTLAGDRVFYTWEPSQADWRQPESRLQAARLDVSVAVMQDRYNHAFLKNDARPAAVVVHEQFDQIDERDAWRRQFRASHQGPDNAGHIAFTEAVGGDKGVTGALDVKVLGFTAKDSQFLEQYREKLKAITVAFGVPMARLGDATESTFSNSSEAMTAYWQNTLLPIALDFADALNIQLLPRYGRAGVGWFDTSEVAALQEGAAYQKVGLPALVDSGILVRDEARAFIGRDPHPDPKIGAATGPLLGADGVPLPAPKSLVGTLYRPVDVRGYPPADRHVRRINLWNAADAQVTTLENAWSRTFRRLFDRQSKAVVDRLEGKRGRQMLTRATPNAGDVFDPAFWTATTTDIAEGLFADVFTVGGARVAEKFGIAFDLTQPGVADQITSRAEDLAGKVTDTTYEQIRGQLAEGVTLGETIPALAERVRAVFAYASDTRATTIARTEVISAFNGAQKTAVADLPADVVAGQEWIATTDGRTRPEHAEADGQIVPIGEPFTVGGERLEYPGDPNGSAKMTIQCRCAIAFLTPTEMAAQ